MFCPTTLQNLCDQQTTINESVSSNKASCPLSQGKRTWQDASEVSPTYETISLFRKSFTFCNRFIKKAIHVNFSLIRGAGGLAISPILTIQTVVSADSPVYRLIAKKKREIEEGRVDGVVYFDDYPNQLENLFRGGSRPSEILPDGTSILHVSVVRWYPKRNTTNTEFLGPRPLSKMLSTDLKAMQLSLAPF